jgi:WD40 repeat protein
MKTKNESGQITGVTTCAYNHKGELLMAGCEDGSIQIFDEKSSGSFHRPEIHIKKA